MKLTFLRKIKKSSFGIRLILSENMILLLLLSALIGSTPAIADGDRASPTFKNFRDCDDCSEMIVIPSGKYMMGATQAEFSGKDKYQFMYLDETPRHEVRVKSFALAKFSVTRKQFAIFAKETGFHGGGCNVFNGKESRVDGNADWKNPGFKQTDRDPVVCVSWNDAQKFIAWLNSTLSRTQSTRYRLPTEAEWEYAARAGTVTETYWGENRLDQCKYENARDLAARVLDPQAPLANCNDGYVETAPVGSFRPNPWGLFDMLGNASQWIADCHEFGDYRLAVPNANSESCVTKSQRGGSWATIPIGVRSASRNGVPSDTRENTFGFRLAIDLPK